jgi:hypothetical protein
MKIDYIDTFVEGNSLVLGCYMTGDPPDPEAPMRGYYNAIIPVAENDSVSQINTNIETHFINLFETEFNYEIQPSDKVVFIGEAIR